MSSKKLAMSDKLSICVRTLHQVGKVPVAEMMDHKKYPNLAQFSRATLFRHAKKSLDDDSHDRRHFNPGRLRLGTERNIRIIKRQISVLRESVGTFTSRDLQVSSGLSRKMSNLTFRRLLKKIGYAHKNTRRKGMLLKSDLKKRLAWYHKAKRHRALELSFWQIGISMYIDAVGFEYKSNPYDHAKCLGKREWRTLREGLHYGCTAKGCKEGKKYVKVMVGMSYDKGVVMCVPLLRKMSGEYFCELIDENIIPALITSAKSSRRILQDGCPCQNSKRAYRLLDRRGIKVFSIPARSPDLNPIENLFNQVRGAIKKDSLQTQIKYESKEEFKTRVSKIMTDLNVQRVNNLINSMPKRVKMLQSVKGQRMKY